MARQIDGQGPGSSPTAESWQRVLGVMEHLAASSDLGEILGLVIDSLRDCLHADRASVFQYDPVRHELFAERAHGVDRSLRFSADAGLAGEAAKTRRIVNVQDCYADSRFNPVIDRQTGYRTRCMLTIPLVSFDGGLEGVAQVLNKADPGTGEARSFDEADEAIARALATQAGIALRRARLIEAEKQRNKYEADLATARLIQQASLPASLPEISGYSVAAQSKPADETGGDSFDVLSLHTLAGAAAPAGARAAEGAAGTVLFMADASGHGIGPALSVTQVHAMLRMGARLGAPIDHLCAHLNRQLCGDLPLGRFVTAFIGLLLPGEHRVRYVSAGQSPILVVRAGRGRGEDGRGGVEGIGGVEDRMAGSPPLGIDETLPPPRIEEIELGPGDVLLVLSDGYYEARDMGRALMGVERVVEAVGSSMAGSAGEILGAINEAVAAFACGRPADDDRTAVIVKREVEG